MTPLQMAHQECANSVNNRHLNERPCLLEKRGAQCRYFERCLLPLAHQRPDLFGDVERLYWGAAAKMGPTTVLRSCPDCGEALGPKRRLCDSCRALRRRTAERASRGKLATQQLVENPCHKSLCHNGPKPEKSYPCPSVPSSAKSGITVAGNAAESLTRRAGPGPTSSGSAPAPDAATGSADFKEE